MRARILIVDDQQIILNMLQMEKKHPGITQVKRDARGAIILDEK